MSYLHGIYGTIAPTAMPASNTAKRGIIAVVGTAPVNLLIDPASALKTPILLNGLSDVKKKIGYSPDVDSYTIMQAVHSAFEVFDVAPIVAINVLDPETHKTAKTSAGSMVSGIYIPEDKGILLSSLAVKDSSETTTYDLGSDYTAEFATDGDLVVTRIAGGDIATATDALKLSYDVIDPSKVTAADIVAGIGYIDRIFQTLNIIPEILIAPGYAQNATVGVALIEAAREISTVFYATALVDIDSAVATTSDAAITAKTTNGYGVRDDYVLFPKVMTSAGVTVWYSAHMAALMMYTDSKNGDAPFVSPSNKDAKIMAAVLADGTPVLYTLDEANALNAEGITTALNFQGWRSWGNYTGAYSQEAAEAGQVFDPKDVYINVKRGLDWQSNGFISRYWSKIDDPMNFRAIQSLVTDENAYYNPYINAGYVAGMSIAYDQTENTTESLLAGILKIKQSLTPYLPLQAIENTLQFDVSALTAALGGVTA